MKLTNMNHQYYWLIISLLITIIGTNSYAQEQVIFEKSDNSKYIIRYNKANDANLNYMLQQIAAANNQPVTALELTLSFTQYLRITKQGKELFFDAQLTRLKLNHDVLYKGFVINHLLFPRTASAKLIWTKPKAKTPIKVYDLYNVSIKSNHAVLAHFSQIDTVKARSYELIIRDLNVGYNQSNLQAFNRHKQLIDDYFTASQNMKSAMGSTRQIPLDEIRNNPKPKHYNQLSNYRAILNQNKQLLQEIAGNKYLAVLGADPEMLANRTTRLEALTQQTQHALKELEQNGDKVFYEKGLQLLAHRRVPEAQSAFYKSLEINREYLPAKLELARVAFAYNDFNSSLKLLTEIEHSRAHFPLVRQDAQVLATEHYNLFLNEAAALSHSGRFHEAENWVFKAENLCNESALVACNNQLNFQKKRIADGKYQKQLALAETAIMNNNLVTAENHLNDAEAVFLNYSSFLNSDIQLKQLRQRLYFEYVATGNQKVAEGNYESALISYNNAYRICRAFNYISCTQELTNGVQQAQTGIYKNLIAEAQQAYNFNDLPNAEKILFEAIAYQEKYNLIPDTEARRLLINIKQRQYQSLINLAMENIEADKTELALNNFIAAKNLEQEYNLPPDAELEPMLSQTAVNIVMIKSGQATQYIEAGNLNQARKLFNEMKQVQAKAHQEKNEAINLFINQLDEEIFNLECRIVQNTYKQKEAEAEKLIANRQYAQAENLLNEAVSLVDNNNMCGISNQTAKTIRNQIKKPALYQNLMANIDQNYQNAHYSKIMPAYDEAANYFETENLQNFGLKHVAASDFLNQANQPMLIEATGYYTHAQKLDDALQCLKRMQEKSYKRKHAKHVQRMLGSALAERDYKKNEALNHKIQLQKYTFNNKWFKYLEKQYTSQLKKLQ